MTVLDCVEVGPKGADARGSVIWMHGLGADGNDFAPVVPVLGLPDVRFVFPNAPPMPVTINGGFVMPSWYDIKTLDRNPDRESEPDIRASAKHVEALLAREMDRGVPPERTVLAGFSQGAAMALHVGVRHPQTLAGIMVLSGYRVVPSTFEAESDAANARTPMLFCHGTQDEMLPLALGKEAHDYMVAHTQDAPIAWHEFPIGHSVCPEEIEIIARWLGERFA